MVGPGVAAFFMVCYAGCCVTVRWKATTYRLAKGFACLGNLVILLLFAVFFVLAGSARRMHAARMRAAHERARHMRVPHARVGRTHAEEGAAQAACWARRSGRGVAGAA